MTSTISLIVSPGGEGIDLTGRTGMIRARLWDQFDALTPRRGSSKRRGVAAPGPGLCIPSRNPGLLPRKAQGLDGFGQGWARLVSVGRALVHADDLTWRSCGGHPVNVWSATA